MSESNRAGPKMEQALIAGYTLLRALLEAEHEHGHDLRQCDVCGELYVTRYVLTNHLSFIGGNVVGTRASRAAEHAYDVLFDEDGNYLGEDDNEPEPCHITDRRAS